MKNILYLLLSNVFVRLVTALATILLARHLGSTNYGILSIALAFSSVTGYFIDMGLTHTFIREGTKNESNLVNLLGSFIRIKIMFVVIVCLLSYILIAMEYNNSNIRSIVLWVVIPSVVGLSLQGIGTAYFQLIEKMGYNAIIRCFSGIITALGLFLGLMYEWSLEIIAAVYGVSTLLGGIFSIVIVLLKTKIWGSWERAILNGLASFIFGGFIITLIPQLGPLILQKTTTFEEVGLYSAAFRISSVLYQVPGIVAAAFYPLLFRYGNNNDKVSHYGLNIIQLKVMSLLGMIMALPFLIYTKWWVISLFGEQWIGASSILSILSMVVIVQSINYPLADSLTTIGLQSIRSIILLCGLLIGSISFFVLGTRYGGIGGAIAALIIEITLIIGYTLSNPNGIKLFFNGTKYNFVAFFLSLLVIFIKNIHPLIGSCIAITGLIAFIIFFDKELRTMTLNKIISNRKQRSFVKEGV